jgi:hypothetical protein
MTTAQATSATPILHRQAPLPPQVKGGSGMTFVVALWSVVFMTAEGGVVFGYLPDLQRWFLVDFDHWLWSDWTGARVLLLVASVVAAYFGMIAIHECGHVLGGLAAGFRFQSLRVGPLLINRPFRLSFYRGAGAAINGVAVTLPVTTDKLARRAIVMVLAGPFANLLSASILLLLPFPKGVFSGLLIVFSLTNGLTDLLPFEGRLGVSDGKRIGMLAGNGEMGERWLSVVKLNVELAAGVSPASLSADFLARGIAVRDGSMDTVAAHAFAYMAAFNRNEIARGAELLEVCLTYAGYTSVAMRQALMSDAAVYMARREKRPDLARLWLADIPAATYTQWLRTRVEAAILEVEGDREGALAKLDAFEKVVLALPDATQRRLLLNTLEQWRSELRSAAALVAQSSANSSDVLPAS